MMKWPCGPPGGHIEAVINEGSYVSFSFLSLRRAITGASLFVLWAGSGCSPALQGTTQAHMDMATARAGQGASLFERQCAGCHGERGQGLAKGPAVLGPRALSGPRFRTAADLYEYVSTRMPYPPKRSGSLEEEEYWAIVNFMSLAHGVETPEEGITPRNARTVHIEPSD